MAPTPSKANQTHPTQIKTPQSKLRIHFNANKTNPSPNPNAAAKEAPQDHPVEVITRIRDYPDRKEKPVSVLQINSNNHSIRVRADFGYRDFSLDGVSLSEEEDLDVFYKKFVESRINSVKLGDKCTIMVYGPTGSGKSHTMFGCSKLPGIVYRSLRDILGDGEEGHGTFVQVTVLEIYNEEIFDLLSSNGGGGLGLGWPKGSASKDGVEKKSLGKGESSEKAIQRFQVPNDKLPWTFRLLQVKGLPAWANTSCVSIRDVIQGDVLIAILSNYMVDIDWLLPACPTLAKIPHVLVVHGEGDGTLDHMKRNKPANWILHKPPLPISFGTHHSKAMLLVYPRGVRIIIHTANLIYVDWNNKSQGLWMQDFPWKDQNSPSKGCAFENDLIDYLSALKVLHKTSYVED